MKHHRPLPHPLESLFARSAQSLTTALSDATRRLYEGTFRNFLRYLAAHYPEVSRLKQLQRDPHILGWLADLRSGQEAHEGRGECGDSAGGFLGGVEHG